MRSRALLTLGLALLGALHLSVTGQLLVPLLSVLLAAAATLAGPRLSLHQASQALVLVATVGLVFAAAFLDGPRPTELGGPKLQYVVLSGTALLTVATRLWMHDPERGHGATQTKKAAMARLARTRALPTNIGRSSYLILSRIFRFALK